MSDDVLTGSMVGLKGGENEGNFGGIGDIIDEINVAT